MYTEAIAAKKDQKAYYANRALAYLRKRPAPDWEDAIKDCNTGLDLWEIFEGSDLRKRTHGRVVWRREWSGCVTIDGVNMVWLCDHSGEP